MVWDPETCLLAIGLESGNIEIFVLSPENNYADYTPFTIIKNHKKPIISLAILGDRGIVLSISKDNSIVATNCAKEDNFQLEEKVFKHPLTCLYYHKDSGRIFIGTAIAEWYVYKFEVPINTINFNRHPSSYWQRT